MEINFITAFNFRKGYMDKSSLFLEDKNNQECTRWAGAAIYLVRHQRLLLSIKIRR